MKIIFFSRSFPFVSFRGLHLSFRDLHLSSRDLHLSFRGLGLSFRGLTAESRIFKNRWIPRSSRGMTNASRGMTNASRGMTLLFLCISIYHSSSLFAADKLVKPDGYVAVYNACTQPVWIWTTWTSDNRNIPTRNKTRKYHRLDKIEPGKEFNFGGTEKISAQWPINGTMQTFNPNLNSWNGLAALRLVPKMDCDKWGTNCNIGESILSVPDINDNLYDHLYYSPEGLYTTPMIGGTSMAEFLRQLGSNLSPEQKTAAADTMKKAIYSADSIFPQPSIESSFEGTFKCKSKNPTGDSEDQICQTTASQLPLNSGNYYDISFVDGFTLPVYVKTYQNPNDEPIQDRENSAACTDIDGSNHMPIPSAIAKSVPTDILSRGNRPNFADVCTMAGVTLKADFFQNQPKYNFEKLNATIISPKNGETVGCASPKARLLMHGDEEKKWLKNGEEILDNLYRVVDSGSQEYDSRTIQFACPYAQGNLEAFQETICGNFQYEPAATPDDCLPNPSLCSKTLKDKSQELKYLSPYDENSGRYGAYLPFKMLIDKNLNNPAFRATDRRGQGANNLCHGPIMKDGTYKGSDYPIENTGWVKSLRANSTNVYTYTFDDASGLRRCNSSKSSFVYVLCGDETFIKNQL